MWIGIFAIINLIFIFTPCFFLWWIYVDHVDHQCWSCWSPVLIMLIINVDHVDHQCWSCWSSMLIMLINNVDHSKVSSFFRAFATKIGSVPVKILAVTETGANVYFTSESVQMLLKEGNAFADSIHASFMTTCTNFQTQSMSINTTIILSCIVLNNLFWNVHRLWRSRAKQRNQSMSAWIKMLFYFFSRILHPVLRGMLEAQSQHGDGVYFLERVRRSGISDRCCPGQSSPRSDANEASCGSAQETGSLHHG